MFFLKKFEFPYLGGYAIQGADHRIPVRMEALQMTYRVERVREQGRREREEMHYLHGGILTVQHSAIM